MFEEYAPICFAVKYCKQIIGRKRFQKLIYLSQVSGIPFKEIFEWNYFGPFSRQLATEIDSLSHMNILQEEQKGSEFIYTITEQGDLFLKDFISKNPKSLDHFNRVLSELIKYNTYDLEKLASIKFLMDQSYPKDYIINFLKHTKDYSPEEIGEGKKLLGQLFKTLDSI